MDLTKNEPPGLFPPHLSIGSAGRSVQFLQQLLWALGCGGEARCDGVYDRRTADETALR